MGTEGMTGPMGLIVRFVLASLASWRVTHMLAHEDGPADVFVRLRKRVGDGFAGSLMDCFQCLSLWIAAVAAVFVTRSAVAWVVSWLAVSGAACLLERMGGEPPLMIERGFSNEEEDDHVLR